MLPAMKTAAPSAKLTCLQHCLGRQSKEGHYNVVHALQPPAAVPRLHALQVAQADGLLRVMQTLPPREAVVPPGQPPLLPPPQCCRPTLLLDLDQTLVRSCPLPEGQALLVRMRRPSCMHAVAHAVGECTTLSNIDIVVVVMRLCVRVGTGQHTFQANN
jgi:hypothetical protein